MQQKFLAEPTRVAGNDGARCVKTSSKVHGTVQRTNAFRMLYNSMVHGKPV